MKKPKKGILFILIGVLLILAALAVGGYFLWESGQAAKQSTAAVSQIEELTKEKAQRKTGLPTDDPDRVMPTVSVTAADGTVYRYIGTLEIPELGLTLPVMEDWSYSKLKVAPCRFSGTVYANNMVIAAHNYRSHFGALKNLTGGAKLYFTDVEGNRYSYEVETLETLQPTQVEEMTSGNWGLTLFTCTPGGKTRVTVRCNRIS